MPLSSQPQRPPSQRSWFPNLNYQVWILATGRLLSQVGSGFTLLYLPIFFVNQVGLSATAVGFALGSSSISGVVGRFVGGSLADSPRFGRKPTILISALLSAIASLVLAVTQDFSLLVVGNLLMGLGTGLYWPSTESLVADLTTPEQRNEAFALNRLADNLGLGLGVILAGLLIKLTNAYRALFVIDGVSFLVFAGLVYFAIQATQQPERQQTLLADWQGAVRDRALLLFLPVNVLFTVYIVQIYSTIPLYLSNFVKIEQTGQGFSPAALSALFSWQLLLTVLCQLPIARWLNRFRRPQALMISALLWGVSFAQVWVTGVVSGWQVLHAGLAVSLMALALATYLPSASSLVVDLAPPTMRGVYLSVNSQCWALGYFIGPPLGGLALDQPKPIPDVFWLALALSILVGLVILQQLDRLQFVDRHS